MIFAFITLAVINLLVVMKIFSDIGLLNWHRKNLNEKLMDLQSKFAEHTDTDIKIMMPKNMFGKPLNIQVGPDSRWVRITIQTPSATIVPCADA